MALDSTFLEPPYVGVGNKGKLQEDDEGHTASNEDGADSIRQQSEDDLEDGELEDDEQEDEEIAVPAPEKLAESKEIPPVVPAAPVVPTAIPSLLDLKISPPRNGIMGNSSGKKSSRWARKPVNRKRYAGREYGDSEDEDAEEMMAMKRSRKRKADERKAYARYMDHDRNEDENGTEYSDPSWYNSARGPRKKFGRLNQVLDDGSDSPLGPYDSPYASPPGPYDSPSASEDDEVRAVKRSEQSSRRDPSALDTDRRQATEKEVISELHENASDVAVEIEKRPMKNDMTPLYDSDEDGLQNHVAAEGQSPKKSVPLLGRRQEPDNRGKFTNNSYPGVRKGSRSPEPQHQKKRRLIDTPWDERPVCRFYYEGKCQKGSECQFKHSRPLIKKPVLCRYYNKNGQCSRGQDCAYHHETWPCVAFHKKSGAGCPHGDDCRFSHEELTEEMRELFEKATAEEEPQHPIEESEPKKKSLLGDFPLLPPADKRIPSLFDINIPRPSMMPAGNRSMGPRGFGIKAAMNRFSHLGPRPRLPPRHIAMQFIRMQMAAFMRPRHGSIRGQFPFMPMFADVQKMGFDPNLLNAFSQSEDFDEDEGADWNEEEQEEYTEDDVVTNADANVTSASESVAVSSAASQPVMLSASGINSTATVAISCSLPVSSSTSLPPVQSSMTSVSTESTTTSTQQSAPTPSVVAGVDLTHLPPVQRDLFLRIHQQQQNNAVPESVIPVTTPAVTDSSVSVNIENNQQTVASIAATTQSSTSNLSVSDILKVLVQQPPPANTARLPLAPMFNINQVLSAINQVPSSVAAPLASVETRLANRELTDSELEMNGVRTSVEYDLRPYDCDTGTVVPAYMDLNDSAWDEDPRVQHWRHDVELGRMPRREERRKPAVVSKAVDVPPVKRDPRLRNDVAPVTSQLPMQQQQLHIQQMVQQMINNNQQQQSPMASFAPPVLHPMPVPPMIPGNMARVHMPPPVPTVMPVADVRVRPPGFPAGMPPGMPLMGMVSPSSVAGAMFPPLLSFNPSVPPPFMAASNSIPSGALPMNSLALPPSTSLMSTAVTAAQSVSVAPVSDVSENARLSWSTALNSVSNSAIDASSISPTYTDDVSESKSNQPPKSGVDYRNDPRFRKRKNQSNDSVVKSDLLPAAKTGEMSSDTDVGSVAETGRDKDVLQFQSPLAATSVSRSTSSGYNRPPNKRYTELVEQNGQYQRRPTKTVVDVAVKKFGFNAQRQMDISDVSAVGSPTHSGNHYQPLMSSTESMLCETQLEGSVKDMFKTIDPTASPFC